jgi:hypothetical protein
MKLYATVSSERASKGQGGNKHLDIKIQSGDEQAEVLRILYNDTPNKRDKYTARIVTVAGEMWALKELLDETNKAILLHTHGYGGKGEKQKGDMCTDGKPHRYIDGECTGEDCYK